MTQGLVGFRPPLTGEQRARAVECATLIASGTDVLFTDSRQPQVVQLREQVQAAYQDGLALLGLPVPASVSEHGLNRVQRGAFFTPAGLAETIVGHALAPHSVEPYVISDGSTGWRVPRVADISCGAGAFLVAAVRHLADQVVDVADEDQLDELAETSGVDDPWQEAARIAIDNVYGVDLDPASVAAADLALKLLVPDMPNLHPNLRVGDALIGQGHPDMQQPANFPETPHRFDWGSEFPQIFDTHTIHENGFDVVVGNPPYLGGNKITGVLGQSYRDHLVTHNARGTRGSADLVAYFWLRMHELANDLGTVGIVATNTLLQGATARVGEVQLAKDGWRRYRTERDIPWPGDAAVVCTAAWTHKIRYVPHEQSSDSRDVGGAA